MQPGVPSMQEGGEEDVGILYDARQAASNGFPVRTSV